MKVAIVITNYNMPERCDALCDHISEHVEWPYKLLVVDNGSDLVPPSKHSNVFLEENKQTCGGWLAGFEYADSLEEAFFAYWVMITSAEFPPDSGDVLTPLAQFLISNPDAVVIHPALTEDSTTAFSWLKTRGGSAPRRTFEVDNIAALWRASWFDSTGRFDPLLTMGWGVDLETSWKARRDGFGVWVHEGVRIKKITDIGYAMDRMNMTAEERRNQGVAEMESILIPRYGPGYLHKLGQEFVIPGWR